MALSKVSNTASTWRRTSSASATGPGRRTRLAISWARLPSSWSGPGISANRPRESRRTSSSIQRIWQSARRSKLVALSLRPASLAKADAGRGQWARACGGDDDGGDLAAAGVGRRGRGPRRPAGVQRSSGSTPGRLGHRIELVGEGMTDRFFPAGEGRADQEHSLPGLLEGVCISPADASGGAEAGSSSQPAAARAATSARLHGPAGTRSPGPLKSHQTKRSTGPQIGGGMS